MGFLIGLTPRSRRAFTRRKRAQNRQQLEQITRNLGEYIHIKRQMEADKASNLRLERTHAQKLRDDEMTARAIERLMQSPLDKLDASDVEAKVLMRVLDDDDDAPSDDG
jgi:transcriptional/translational regulatory protein YebC/TACO1